MRRLNLVNTKVFGSEPQIASEIEEEVSLYEDEEDDYPDAVGLSNFIVKPLENLVKKYKVWKHGEDKVKKNELIKDE